MADIGQSVDTHRDAGNIVALIDGDIVSWQSYEGRCRCRCRHCVVAKKEKEKAIQ